MLQLLWKLNHLTSINGVAETLNSITLLIIALNLKVSIILNAQAIRGHIVYVLHLLKVLEARFHTGLGHEGK